MADTYNSTVSSDIGASYVQYSGTIDLTGNLEDSHYTQAFLIAEANNTDAGYTSSATGGTAAGDIQVSLEVSNDRETWNTISTILADHDDTEDIHALLGGTNYEEFHSYKWARLVAAGQTSNDDDTVTWSANLTKNDALATFENSTLLGADVEDSIGD